ncbi:MAG: PhzF family phenazine biosynthesis protein [Gemmatimonadaceae bacterium]|nr:PhzF family phenazine biosynthesis protein [Gemmatimonadaceae bacterium]
MALRSYAFHTTDVFTSTRFGGNQLAVLTDARGLSTAEMHAIAREFNYSESTFVLPPDDRSHTRRVRIFTPGGEVPFAGHPTVGTALVLAVTGELPLDGDETKIVLEEGVGPVAVSIRAANGVPDFAELSVARLPEVLSPVPAADVLAAMLSLGTDDLAGGAFHPQAVSCGLPFTFVPLRSRDAVRRARLKLDLWESALARTPAHMVMVFALDAEDPAHQVRARMFAPGESVPEDPATGSACAALGGYLGLRDHTATGTLRWIVEQGYEMGRPSLLHVSCDKRVGAITAVRVGGSAVLVSSGTIRL